MEEQIDMILYPHRHGTTINIGFTFNNKTPRFIRAEQLLRSKSGFFELYNHTAS